MHWLSFKGHLKKVFYTSGKNLNLTLTGRSPYKTNKSCNICVFYVHKTYMLLATISLLQTIQFIWTNTYKKSKQEHRSNNWGAMFSTNMIYYRWMHRTPNIDRDYLKHEKDFFLSYLYHGAKNILCDVKATLLKWKRNAKCQYYLFCG